MKQRLRMSALPRTFACPSSLVLPHSDYETDFAKSGTSRHEEMEAALINREWHKLPGRVQELLFPDYDVEDIYQETTFFYDWFNDTARTVDKGDDSEPGMWEIRGTADVVAVDRKTKRGLVVDWKSWEEVGNPEINKQTTAYAVSLARVFDLEEVTVAIAYLGEGKGNVEVATLDAVDLDAFRPLIRDLHLVVAAASGDVDRYLRPGRQCRWCPAFHDCPEQQRFALQLASEAMIAEVERRMPLTDDGDAVAAFDLYERISLFSKRLRDAIYARAAEAPIPLPDGRFLGRVEKRGNLELDADTVYKVVKAKHGQEVADLAVERVATQTRLESALKTTGPKSLAAAKKEVIDAVEKLGGCSRTSKTSIEKTTADKLSGPREVPAGVLDAANRLLQGAIGG